MALLRFYRFKVLRPVRCLKATVNVNLLLKEVSILFLPFICYMYRFFTVGI